MADPHWTSYVGMATGMVGAILGFISNRKVNNLKFLGLRIELKESVIDTRSSYEGLVELVESTNDSRIAISEALGRTNSGEMVAWKKEFEKDTQNVGQLEKELPSVSESYIKFNTNQLEKKLIEIHEKGKRIETYREKYTAAMTRVDEDRRQLREYYLAGSAL